MSNVQAKREAAARAVARSQARRKPVVKKAAAAKKFVAPTVAFEPKPEAKKPAGMKVSAALLEASRRPRLTEGNVKVTADMMFQAARPAPGVLPANTKLAMDSGIQSSINWGISQYGMFGGSATYFMGYPYLSELAQVPEYRLISEVIATEMTRKWITVKSKSEDAGQAERIEQLVNELERLGVREAFKTIAEQDGFFGRTHLYLDTGATDDRKELMTPLFTEGKKGFSSKKLDKGQLRAIKTVEPVWCYPANYNSSDPLSDGWYNPDQWFTMGKQLHKTRLLTFVSKPVPDMLKPAFAFGGLSMTQMAKPYVDNWLQTRQSVNDLIHAFSVMVLKTDLATMLQGGAPDELMDRCDLFDNLRDNRGVMVLNKETEDFANVSASLGTLDKLQAQAQEHICSVSRLPLVKYTGISPSGLNASSDGEIRVFYDTVHAQQESFFSPHLWSVFRLAQINLWGGIDDDLSFDYNPLWEMDEVQLASKRKTDADTAGVYIDKGILAPEECRMALAKEPGSLYGSIDVDDVPEPAEPEPENMSASETDDGGEGGPSAAEAPAAKPQEN